MPTPNRHLFHVRPHAPDLAQSMPLGLPARAGVAVEVQLRSNDNSNWRAMPFSALPCLSLSLVTACVDMLAVPGTFISVFIGFFDPLVLSLVVTFCCNYPALMRSVPSFFFLVRSLLLSSHFALFPSLPLIHCL